MIPFKGDKVKINPHKIFPRLESIMRDYRISTRHHGLVTDLYYNDDHSQLIDIDVIFKGTDDYGDRQRVYVTFMATELENDALLVIRKKRPCAHPLTSFFQNS